MSISLRRAFIGAGLLLSTAAVTASPVVLDTEQKAAAGLVTALFKSEVPRSTTGAVDAIVDYVDTTFRAVSAVTTPAALLAAPGGITGNCSISGTFKAKMSAELPRKLRVDFHDCTTLWFGMERFLSGPIVITLPEDSLEPEHLLAVRLGNDSAEFFERTSFDFPDQKSETLYAFRMVLRGDIAMWYAASNTSAFVMTGYYDQRSSVESPRGAPPYFLDFKTTTDRLSVVRVRASNETFTLNDDDTLFERGSVKFLNSQPAGTWTDAYSFNDFRVHYITDYDARTNQLTIDGRINVTRNAAAEAGCMDGVYAIKTRLPLLSLFDSGERYERGELVINGDVVTKLFSAANTPPGFPVPVNGMLVSNKVRNVGTFNYDVSNWFHAVYPLGQCGS